MLDMHINYLLDLCKKLLLTVERCILKSCTPVEQIVRIELTYLLCAEYARLIHLACWFGSNPVAHDIVLYIRHI